MRRVGLALAAAALLAGCASPGGGPGFGFAPSCPPAQATARWSEPGLYAALANATIPRGWELPTDGDVLLPLHGGAVAALPDPRLMMLQRREPSHWVRIESWRPGETTVEMPYADNATVLARLDETVDALGLAGHPERPAWGPALLATRGQDAYLRATLAATPDVDALLERLGPANATDEREGIGAHALSWEGWTLLVRVPSKALRVEGATRGQLSVDALDRAEAWGELRANETAMEGMQRIAREAFAALGLPSPRIENATGGSGGCAR